MCLRTQKLVKIQKIKKIHTHAPKPLIQAQHTHTALTPLIQKINIKFHTISLVFFSLIDQWS